MTSEDIKNSISMREIVSRYGIKINRSGMCSCPFHGADRKPSMKIYRHDYHCFTCGANGDIFTFVQEIENCDFKTAFLLLGGEYKHISDQEKREAEIKREIEKIVRYSKEQQEVICKKMLSDCINLARTSIMEDTPFSDRWCLSQDAIPTFIHWWDVKYIEGEEVPRLEIYRKCEEFKQRYNSSASSDEGALVN